LLDLFAQHARPRVREVQTRKSDKSTSIAQDLSTHFVAGHQVADRFLVPFISNGLSAHQALYPIAAGGTRDLSEAASKARHMPHLCLWTIKPRHLFIRFAAEILCETNRSFLFSREWDGLGSSANDLRKKAALRHADRGKNAR